MKIAKKQGNVSPVFFAVLHWYPEEGYNTYKDWECVGNGRKDA